jgi:hypothetical protein
LIPDPMCFVENNPIPLYVVEYLAVLEVTYQNTVCCEDDVVVEDVLW